MQGMFLELKCCELSASGFKRITLLITHRDGKSFIHPHVFFKSVEHKSRYFAEC